jgi:histone H3/H4
VKPHIAKRRHKREFSIPKVSFRKLVEEIASNYKSDLRFQKEAIEALQESAETLISDRFARCSELADLCKLDTVRHEHWRFVQGASVPC